MLMIDATPPTPLNIGNIITVRRGREIPFEPEDPSRDNVESPR